jgi:hypothetical protein
MTTTTLTRPTGAATVSKAFRIELPDAERGRDERDLRLLDEINARLDKPPVRRSGMSAEKAREADLRARAALERKPYAKAEEDAVKAGIEEAAQLAEARGEDVDRPANSNKLDIRSRDSLRNLLNAGKLTHDQYDTGAQLREAYERRDTLGSQMSGLLATGSPTYDNSAAVFYGVQTAKALARISVIEREVAIQCRTEPAALQMLREVVGLGKAITAFGRSDSVLERHTKALAMALDVADAVIRGR